MERRLIFLLVGFIISCHIAIRAAECSENRLIADFENGSNALSDGWDLSAEVVADPAGGSGKCLKASFTETWGTVAKFDSYDYANYGLSFMVYTESVGEVKAKAYNPSTEENFELSYSIFEANKWTKVSFDFSKLTPTSNSIQIFTGAKNSIYIDDVQLVCLDNLEGVQGETGMEIPYSYGRVAIGGGGFVSGIIASGNAKFARTDVGGAYKWNDEDCSWMPLTNFISEADQGLLSIEALAVDPANENNIYLLGGCQYYSNQKTAVLCSKDGGKTFSVSDVSSLIYVHGNGQGRNCGERLAVDPNDGNIILCGGRVNNPIIKSTDGGKTWSALSSFPTVYTKSIKWPSWGSSSYSTTPDENGITSIVFDKNTKMVNGATGRIFVGVSRTGATNVYLSEDGGSSWSEVAGLPTSMIPLRMKFDGNGDLLIAYSNLCVNGSNGGVYRYNPTTKVATDISPDNKAIGDVAVSPKDPNKLVASTNNTWIPQKWDNGKSANGDIIYTSIDGGKTWRSLQNDMVITNNGVTWIPGYAIHWCGSVCFDPTDDNKVSFASGNGIFTSNNIWCDASPTFYFDVNGLEETVALDMVSVPDGDPLSVIGDYTGFIHKDIHEFAPIHDPAPGTSGGINYYSKDPNVMMRVANEGFYYTTDGHDGWEKMQNTAHLAVNQYNGSSMPSIEGKCAITKKDGTLRYFVIPEPHKSGIYYSDNNGDSWSLIAGTSAAAGINVDPVNDAYVYAVGKNVFFVSSDYGSSFQSKSMENGEKTRVTVVAGQEGLIYLPCGVSGLKVSTDFGATFSSINKVTSCSAVGVGKGTSGNDYNIYIWGKANGNAVGIYCSEDKGINWKRINDDQNQFGGPGNGAFIVGDWNVPGRFYMSTVGLGIVYGELAENATATQWKCFVDNTDCNPTVGIQNNLSLEAPVVVSPSFSESSFNILVPGSYIVTDILGNCIEQGVSDGNTSIGEEWSNGIFILSINGKTFKLLKK